MTIDKARDEARKRIKAISKQEADPESFTAVAADWYQRHVIKNGLRSADELRRLMKRYINDAWPGRAFVSIRRKDINDLLDRIEDDHGLRQADYVFSTIRQICNWYAVRDDEYTSPIVPGMRRRKAKEHERKRILSDDEIRTLWDATKDGGSYSRCIRFLLLTGQRREKVATMRWDDVDGSKWTIPTEKREKGNAGVLVLPELALDALGECGEGYIFTSRTGYHLTDWTGSKRRLDEKSGITDWVLHDLRRTARSLMSRVQVQGEIAERVLGHAREGVESVYDRHEYRDEKADALKRLAGLVELILNPPKGNVVKLVG
jgi:integrase